MAKRRLTETQLMTLGTRLGFDTKSIERLIKLYGVALIGHLFSMLQGNHDQLKAAMPKALVKTGLFNPVLAFLVSILVNEKGQIESWLDEGEGVLFDEFTSIVSSKHPLIAAILEAWRTKFVQAGDAFTNKLLDDLIVALQNAETA